MRNQQYFYDRLAFHKNAEPYWDVFYKKHFPRYQDHYRLDDPDKILQRYDVDLFDKDGNTFTVKEIAVDGYYDSIYGELIEETVDGRIVEGWLISSPAQLLVYAFAQRDKYRIFLWSMDAPRQANQDNKLPVSKDGRGVLIPIDLIARFCDPIEAFITGKQAA